MATSQTVVTKITTIIVVQEVEVGAALIAVRVTLKVGEVQGKVVDCKAQQERKVLPMMINLKPSRCVASIDSMSIFPNLISFEQQKIHEISNHDVVHVYHQYGVYDSPIPATFIRRAPLFSPQAIHSSRPEECLDIVLTSEIGEGATGVVHRGSLMPKIRDYTKPMDVVVKLAFDVEQRKALRSEYEIYRHLWLKGIHRGIMTALGLFDDSEDGACALVMLYSGVPLPASADQGNLSISDW